MKEQGFKDEFDDRVQKGVQMEKKDADRLRALKHVTKEKCKQPNSGRDAYHKEVNDICV